MNFKKNFTISFLIIFGLFLGFTIGAADISELQNKISQIQAQLSQLQNQPNCHKDSLWGWDYCKNNCKCNAGEGDCDGDFHCNTGYCALDVGAKYGQSKWIDVCEEKISTGETKKNIIEPVVSKEILTPTTTSSKSEPPPIKKGSLALSLAADNPITQTILTGTKDFTFLKFQLTADDAEDVKINSLKTCFFRLENGTTSISLAGDILNPKLYEDDSQIGLTQTNLIEGCTYFTNLNFTLSKSTSKTLTLKVDFPISSTTLTLFAKIDGADFDAVGITSKAPILTSGLVISNQITLAPLDSLYVSISPDTPVSTNIVAGTNNISILKFTLSNPLNKPVSITDLSLILEGEAKPNNFGAIYWKLDEKLLGVSYFGSVGSTEGFTTLSNLPTYKDGKKIKPALFEIASSSTATLEVSTDLKSDAIIGATFQFSLLKDFYITCSQDINIVGFPIKSNIMTIGASSCLDSDGGINEYTFGKTTVYGLTHRDACFLGDNLKEWVCTSAGAETYKLIECEYGCVDGVCKKATGNDSSTGVICLDSDGGKDYFTYGYLKHGDGTILDFDTCQSETTLRENYCNNGYFAQETYECPKGCQNNACVSEEKIKNIENNLATISETISKLIERFKEIIGK